MSYSEFNISDILGPPYPPYRMERYRKDQTEALEMLILSADLRDKYMSAMDTRDDSFIQFPRDTTLLDKSDFAMMTKLSSAEIQPKMTKVGNNIVNMLTNREGRTFSGLINNFVDSCQSLNEEYLPVYETPEGRKAYEETLQCVKTNFPQYIRELEGTADGAKVEFHKLFLLHMDDIILRSIPQERVKQAIGCSTICVNQNDHEILGHTEDALSDTLNHFYFVSAHIIEDKPQGKWKVTEERFTSLCYAGHLPGYTMNYNHHGLVFTINTISAKNLKAGKTPRHFITRALLSAENFLQAQHILRDSGCGAGDGCSVNMTFLKQEGDRLFHNAEMGPADKTDESQLNILTASPGENIYHCNAYLRSPIEQCNERMLRSSNARYATFRQYQKPRNKEDVIKMLSDESDKEYRVFQDSGYVRTIAVGIFDCKERTWSLYADNPTKTEPLVVLPLVIKQ